nr:FtsX-like permease family protein [Gemmatimonadota bacterium]
MTMLWVLRLLHVPFWKRRPLGSLLPVLGVALGVATIVAIDLAGTSAVRSFRETLERLDGRTTHRVVGPHLSHDLARRLGAVPGVEAAAPIVEAVGLHDAGDRLPIEDAGEPLRLFGIDPLSEGMIRSLGVELAGSGNASAGLLRDFLGRPGALLVSAPFLERHGLAAGDALPLVVGTRRSRALVLAALPREVGGLEVPDNLAVGDIATVQELAGTFAGVDRVDLVLAERDGARERVLAELLPLLPTGAVIERPGGQAGRLERGLAAFRANIRALSYLALFVSFFLIYNSLLVSVLRRRPLIGIARCLGATRRQVLAGWLGEALLTACAGVAIGAGLGLLFAAPALAGVSRTAEDLYGGLGRGTLKAETGAFVRAGALGLAFTLLSALLPALEAAGTAPAHTATRS